VRELAPAHLGFFVVVVCASEFLAVSPSDVCHLLVLCSPAWRAPETFEDHSQQIVSHKTDVYMFGGLIFEVLTGKSPWWWLANGQSILKRRLTSENNVLEDADVQRVRLTYHCKDPVALHELDALMRSCLRLQPKDRPTMVQICEDLQRITAVVSANLQGGSLYTNYC
jgi:serine/threonine protein kinase